MIRIYKLLKSVKLAVVLICLIAVGSIVASLIPQGRDAAFYAGRYGELTAQMVITLGLTSFFSSIFFISLVSLFSLNLGVCTVDRLYRELTGRKKKRFGPDLIHIGLLILIVGGLITYARREEGFVYLSEGETVELTDGLVLTLQSYDFYTYEDGRPRDWISVVDVFEDDVQIADDAVIEVNHPLDIGKLELFQSSYGRRPRVVFRDPQGRERYLDQGGYFTSGEDIIYFAGITADADTDDELLAGFQRVRNRNVVERYVLKTGDTIDQFTVSSIRIEEVTGIRIVHDPGYLPVLIGFILCVIGLVLTYARKIGDEQI